MFRLSQTSRNRKSAKSVLRMVFKSLETFLNRFNFPTLMRCKVKLLEILLRPSHTLFCIYIYVTAIVKLFENKCKKTSTMYK